MVRIVVQAQEMGLVSCITADDYEANGRGVPLRNLAPGNYSLRVTPLSLSGAGNASTDLYVFIPVSTHGKSLLYLHMMYCICVQLQIRRSVSLRHDERSDAICLIGFFNREILCNGL